MAQDCVLGVPHHSCPVSLVEALLEPRPPLESLLQAVLSLCVSGGGTEASEAALSLFFSGLFCQVVKGDLSCGPILGAR